MTIRGEISMGIAEEMQGFHSDIPFEKLPLGSRAIWIKRAMEILRYLDSKGVVVIIPQGKDLAGCCIARLERLVEE